MFQNGLPDQSLPSMEDLQHNNEYILISGSSSGIGREIALSLSEYYNIILHGRNNQKLLEVAQSCQKNHKTIIWNYDLTDSDNIESGLKDFIRFNKIKISNFIHSAGQMKMYPLKMVSQRLLYETMSINLISAILICKTLTSKPVNGSILKNIVFISSNISNFGAKAMSVYGASKSALDGFMRSLAVELAPGTRVNSILPGGIKTEMTESIFENTEIVERMKSQYPLGFGKTTDIADVVKFLISDQSRWITGQQLIVDGGRTINISG